MLVDACHWRLTKLVPFSADRQEKGCLQREGGTSYATARRQRKTDTSISAIDTTAIAMTEEESVQAKELEEEESALAEADEVYRLLRAMESRDPGEAAEAREEVDRFLKKREEGRRRKRDGTEDGCRVSQSRTSLNVDVNLRRERRAEKLKQEGNEHFARGEYKAARELYTSSILESDTNPLVFTNRAQARIHLGEWDDAVEDCRRAIKLRPDLVKAQIHLARALKGKGDFQAAVDVLEIAEESSSGYEDVLRRYKADVVKQMKHSLMSKSTNLMKLKD